MNSTSAVVPIRYPKPHPAQIQVRMTLPPDPTLSLAHLQGTQSRHTKPTLQRAKNANAQPTAPQLTNIYQHLFDTSAKYLYSTPSLPTTP